jgi:cell division septation protein DedD
MESRYRKTMLRLAILCNVVGAALVVIFVISQQDPSARKMRPLAALARAREPSAPAVLSPSPVVSGTHVYGPFLPPGLGAEAKAGTEAPKQGKETSGGGGRDSTAPKIPLPQISSPFPRLTSPMPVVMDPAAATGAGEPRSLQVTIPANIFADEQQAAEVATLLGTQLSRQGYLTTVVVTDQQKITSVTTPTDTPARRAAPRPFPPAAGRNVPAGPRPSTVIPPLPANPPVTIAREPSSVGMPQPPLVLPPEIPRDAPGPGRERPPAARERTAEAGQEAVKRAAEGILEAWRQAGAAGPSVEQESPAASADRTAAGSVAPEPRAPAAVQADIRNTATRERPKTAGPPPALAATPKALETSSRRPTRERSTADPGRPTSHPIYQVTSVYEVWAALLKSRPYALQIQQELREKGFTFHLRDLSTAGQQKYILWAGPYASRSAAESLERNLNKQGYDTAVRPAVRYRPIGRGTTGLYAVQIGSLQDVTPARRLRLALAADGVPAFVDRDKDSALARVCVGPFASQEEAQQSAEHLRQAGYATAVIYHPHAEISISPPR